MLLATDDGEVPGSGERGAADPVDNPGGGDRRGVRAGAEDDVRLDVGGATTGDVARQRDRGGPGRQVPDPAPARRCDAGELDRLPEVELALAGEHDAVAVL